MALVFQNFLFGYQNALLNSPLNIVLNPSEFVFLFGNNGSGKTSFIKTIAHLISPLSGHITFQNQDILKWNEKKRAQHFAFLFTKRPFLMQHTVFDLMALGRTPYLNHKGELTLIDKEIIHRYALALNIQDILNTPAQKISDGQLQKVLISKTLAQQTPVIILDEPLSFLDYGTKKNVLETLKKIAVAERKIILMTSHDIHLCLPYADKVLLFHKKEWEYTSAQNTSNTNLFIDFLNSTKGN